MEHHFRLVWEVEEVVAVEALVVVVVLVVVADKIRTLDKAEMVNLQRRWERFGLLLEAQLRQADISTSYQRYSSVGQVEILVMVGTLVEAEAVGKTIGEDPAQVVPSLWITRYLYSVCFQKRTRTRNQAIAS